MATTPKPTTETSGTTAKSASTTSTSTKEVTTASGKRVIPGISQKVINEMTQEINSMMAFAANKGLIINPDVVDLVKSETIEDLVAAHNMLCKNVAPATPKSITYTNGIREKNRGKSLFKQLPLVRNLIILALIFLIAYVAFGQTKAVNNQSLDEGFLGNDGLPLILNLGFLASIAGLGVLFNLLKKVSSSVLNSTLVPEETINYVSQILLGIISGIITSEVIVLYTSDPQDINLFNKSVLALIGGFSSDSIFTVLQSLISRLESVFNSSSSN
jgi:hypothetical protein